MKKMKFLTYVTFVLFLSFAVSSCSGDDGAMGPAGTDGADGTNGTDGNANVTSVIMLGESITIGYNNFAVSELTQDIYDSGVVLGYTTVSGNSFWETLPVISAADHTVMLEIDRISIGTITLLSTFDQTLNFRFILIASNNSSGRTANPQQAIYNELADAGVDVNDYYAVCAYYDINPE
ncbi:MAG: hypothetical protein QM478_00215 [Flavobacteriaceae bacterium]